jgi:hypothetical protein
MTLPNAFERHGPMGFPESDGTDRDAYWSLTADIRDAYALDGDALAHGGE